MNSMILNLSQELLWWTKPDVEISIEQSLELSDDGLRLDACAQTELKYNLMSLRLQLKVI